MIDITTNNTGPIHSHCAQERHNQWQEENKNTVIKPGDYIKKTFSQEGIKQKEHMWVIVTKVDGTVITGILNNDPRILTNIKCGDQVILDFSEISQYLPS